MDEELALSHIGDFIVVVVFAVVVVRAILCAVVVDYVTATGD